MKIYTKKGDQGETGLIGGSRVTKNDVRIEAYGTIDELIAQLAVAKDSGINKIYKDFLTNIQDQLMKIGSLLASPDDKPVRELPQLSEADIVSLEQEIDELEKDLPALKSFIIPGNNLAVSAVHLARAICRRAERRVVGLSQQAFVDEVILKYLNRLSDYLFVLARRIGKDKGVREINWPLVK